MAEARRVRELAFCALFQLDALGGAGEEELLTARASLEGTVEDARESVEASSSGGEEADAGEVFLAGATAAELDRGLERAASVWGVRRAADAELSGLSPGWPAQRRPAVDRALLRLGWYELRATDAPGAAVISEVVELAKRYSTERSPGFVNAVLDSVLRAARGEGGGDVQGVGVVDGGGGGPEEARGDGAF